MLWAIGDIHGYSLSLRRLLDRIAPEPEDTVVTLGDYIDRGPDTRGVLERLIQLQKECHYVPLRGNHEAMLLAIWLRHQVLGKKRPFSFRKFLRRQWTYWTVGKYRAETIRFPEWVLLGGRQTLASYGPNVWQIEQIPTEHLEFLQQTRLYYETPDAIFTHAAYLPELPMEEQPAEALLFHRLRESIPAPHFSGKKVYVGHSAQRQGEILDVGHLMCIDTFLYGGGWLTAIEVTSGQILQIDAGGKMRGG